MRGQPMALPEARMINMERRSVNRGWQIQRGVWGEDIFRFLLLNEERRSKRSQHSFVLVILDARKHGIRGQSLLQFALPAVASSIRETDVIGWLQKPSVLGIIITQLDSVRAIQNMMIVRAKLEGTLRERLGRDEAAIAISLRIFTDPLQALQIDHRNILLDQFSAIQ
jgi:hypothetical protein